ncbi:diguanylate cyclase domain-containing protein [Segnochrobactraceae bacterium EtOH-i3]
MPLSDRSFAALCRAARRLFDVSAAALCLGETGEVWVDLADGEAAGDWGFARSLSARPDAGAAPLWVADLREDARTAGWAPVTGAPRLRFLASVPVGPETAGRLALFDTRPRPAADAGIAGLRALAEVAEGCLQLRQALRATEAREAAFRVLAETSSDTIVRGDLNGIRLYISPSVRTLLGYEPEEMLGHRALDITHPDDVPAFRSVMADVRAGRLEVGVVEQRQRHKDGHWVWMEASIRLIRDPESGEATGYVASVRGIGRRKELETQLARLASHDDLTGLPNRAAFGQHLAGALARARATGRVFHLFYMDLDHFKQVNDTRGHQAGDAVLREVAARFHAELRSDDVVARLGGDEFAALLWVGRGEAERLANRLIAAIDRPFHIEGTLLTIGLSIGIASADADGPAADELLARADQALYAAKAAGRHRVRVFEALD